MILLYIAGIVVLFMLKEIVKIIIISRRKVN